MHIYCALILIHLLCSSQVLPALDALFRLVITFSV